VERAAVDILQDSPHKDQEGQADPSLLQSCGKGVQSEIQICRDCGLAARRRKIQDCEAQVCDTGATVNDIAELEKILKRATILHDIAGEDIYNSGSGWKPIELIVRNGHAWSKDLHFRQSREIHLYAGNVWEVIRDATAGEPKAAWRPR